MKWFLLILLTLLFVGLGAYIVMAVQSHKRPDDLGLQEDGLLRICPDSPNCVCSEAHSQASEQHSITPLKESDGTWEALKHLVTASGGVIGTVSENYLHATFTSPVFRYVDDVELRRDKSNGLIHIRSASRVGRSDFGVNRKRVQQLKHSLQQ